MTLLEQIKNFKVFDVGDFVVCNDKLLQITQQPHFSYTVRYTDGDWDTYYVESFEEVRKDCEWDILGYSVKTIVNNRFMVHRYHLFVDLERFSAKTHPHLLSEYDKFQLLLDKQEIQNKLDKLK